MRKEILIAFICVSLMLVTPLTAVARENKISRNLTDESDVESLVTQLRVVVNKILEKFGHIPKVANFCNVILNKIDSFWGVLLYFYLSILLEALLTLPFMMLNDIFHAESLFEIVYVIVKYLLFILISPLLALLMVPFILIVFPLIWD
jgi:hypothetical protein